MFLYSDDYEIFIWAKQEEALKYLHLIFTIPIPLAIAFVVNYFISRESQGIIVSIIKYFPIICFLVISCFFILISSLNSIMLLIGFGVSIAMFLIELYLMIYDFDIK